MELRGTYSCEYAGLYTANMKKGKALDHPNKQNTLTSAESTKFTGC